MMGSAEGQNRYYEAALWAWRPTKSSTKAPRSQAAPDDADSPPAKRTRKKGKE
jgi:hypothetical protein